MPKESRRYRPRVEGLEVKLTLSGAAPLSASRAEAAGWTQVAGGQDTYATLTAFTQSYPSLLGGPRYNPEFDLNHNGRIGQDDGKLLLRSLPPLSRRIPISLNLWIAPQDRVRGHHPANSGGVTHSMEPTVLGRTTPGALVFTGSGTVDFKLNGPAVVADSRGNFSYKLTLTAGINQLDFQAVDPYGQQKTLSFPIYWTTYRAYEMKHPRNL